MIDSWVNVREIPNDGLTILLDDPNVWETPLQEFAIPCRILEPLQAEIFVLPQQDDDGCAGCLVRGRLKGTVAVPCTSCAEDATVCIDSSFESFEPFPLEPFGVSSVAVEDAQLIGESIDEAVTRVEQGQCQINPAALVWQEFVLALPQKPLCDAKCAGLCSFCGANLNRQACSCIGEEGDPRLAVLRNLTITKK